MNSNYTIVFLCVLFLSAFYNIQSVYADDGDSFCFNANLPASEVSMFLRNDCTTAPYMICASTYFGCPDDNIEPANTGISTATPGDSNCPTPDLTYVDEVMVNNSCEKTIKRIWTATYPDNASPWLFSTCTQMIFLTDDAPTLTFCPADITVDLSTNGCDQTASWNTPTWTDACGIANVTGSIIPGSTFPMGTTTVTYTATDHCNNTSVCEFDVTITGSCCIENPTIICPANYSACPNGSRSPTVTGTATSLSGTHCDLADISFDDVTTNSDLCNLVIERTWTATYPQTTQSSSCIQLLTYSDTDTPSLSNMPDNIEVSGTGNNCTAIATWTAPTLIDNCNGGTITSSHISGTAFPEGSTIVTYTGSDACGKSTNATFTVTVDCNCDTAPVVICPADFSGCTTASTLPSNTGIATTSDGDSECGIPSVIYSDHIINPINQCGEITIERTWTASDANDNTLNSSCIQTIILVDDTVPVLADVPEDITVTLTGNDCSSVVNWSIPNATDNCAEVELTSTHNSDTIFSEGTTAVVYTATDACGNTTSESFNVTIECICDSPPIISCPINYFGCVSDVIEPTTSGQATTSAQDGCGDNIDITYVDTFLQNTSCVNEIVRTWTATDQDNGLTTTCTQFIGLYDMRLPTFNSAPSDMTINGIGTGCSAVATWVEPNVSDECGLASVTSTHNSGDTFNEGTTTVVYTATDNCGKTTTLAFTVTVNCTCIDPIEFTCVPNYFGCIGSIDPSVTGSPTFVANPDCGPYELTNQDISITNTNCTVELVRIWTLNDLTSGSTKVCTQFIGLYDQELPSITQIPNNVVIESIGKGCNAVATWTPPIASDDCGVESMTSTHQPGDSFPEGTSIVTYTAVDNCGKTTSSTFTVTVECSCESTPLVQCPSMYFGCIGDDLDPDILGTPTYNQVDGCGPIELDYTDNVLSNNVCKYEAVRVWTSFDTSNGNSSSCSQFIGLYDMSDPIINNTPTNVILESSGTNCSIVYDWEEPTATDNCGHVTLTSNYASGSEFFEGTNTVIYTATDGCGRTTMSSFTVTVNCVCNTPPSIVCPNEYISCPGSSIEPINTGTATASVEDGCDLPEVTYTDVTVTDDCGSIITRTWIATDPIDDSLSSSCDQIITLTDTEAPEFMNCPHDVTVDGAGICNKPILWFEPTATDNCGIPTVSSNIDNGADFNEGTTEVIYTAQDGCGNTTMCSFNVTIICTNCDTPPIVNCPSDMTVCIGDDMMPTNTGVATAQGSSSDCTSTPAVTFSDRMITNGPCNGAFVIERTWKATDPETNLSSTCLQTIVAEDNTPPVFVTTLPDIEVDAPASNCYVAVNWLDPIATDDCTAVSLTSTYNSGDTFGEAGTYPVVYTATDACGNSTTTSFNVIVTCYCDEVPVLTCPLDYTACPGSSIDPNNTGTATAVPGWACNSPTVTYTDAITSPSNSCGEIIIVRTWVATDTYDETLTTSCTQLITLQDEDGPTITNLPADISITAPTSACSAIATWVEPAITDGCGHVTVSSNYDSGNTFNGEGIYTVTYTATDACGNVDIASFNVNVTCLCDEVPVIACPSGYSACPGSSLDPTLTGTATTALGNCGEPTITYADHVTIPMNACGETTILRTWTATDTYDTGLTASCTQMLILEDNSAPTITNVPDDIFVDAPASDCFVPVTWVEPTIADGCGNVTVSSNYNSGDTFGEAGTYTVTYTATDPCGESSTASFDVIVTCLCDEVPVLTCPEDYIACPGGSTDPSVTGSATAIPGWACGNPSLTYTDEITNPLNICGEITILRTWTATDTYDNTLNTSCTQLITIVDDSNPVILNIPLSITLDGGDGPNCNTAYSWTEPTATDNCAGQVILSSDVTNGSTFSNGVTVVTYTAIDACGHTSTASFEINVLCTAGSTCQSMPTIECPPDYIGCIGDSYAPSITGTATAIPGQGDCIAPNVTFEDIISSGNCTTGKVILRTWKATDPFNSDIVASCDQTITLDDLAGPTFTNCPDDISVTASTECDAIVNWTLPTAVDDCGDVSITSNYPSGSAFWEGNTTVVYTATDGCGNSSTCSFDVIVTCPSPVCDAPPEIICPGDAVLCIGSSIAPNILGHPIAQYPTHCQAPDVTFSDYILSTGPCAGAKVIDRVWTATYPGTELTAQCTQSIIVSDDIKPVIQNCPSDIVVENQMTIVTWLEPTVIDNCGVDSFVSSHNSGTYYPVGVTTVIYTAIDNCGNTEYCSFTVTVENTVNNSPACQDDIVIGCDNHGGAIVTFDPPTFSNGCTPCTGDHIDGFIYMGSLNGHQYYCSTAPATWTTAQSVATSHGGYLAVIGDTIENTFLANILTLQSAYIGLSDHIIEGDFIWANGDDITYTNWYAGQPNDFNDNQDYVEMLNTGEWNDQYAYSQLEYIMEIPCTGVIQTAGPTSGTYLETGTYTVEYTAIDGCNDGATCTFDIIVEEALTIDCPEDVTISSDGRNVVVNWQTPTATSCCSDCSASGDIAGYIYMGQHNGSSYYCSTETSTWQVAQNICEGYGGYLAVINDAEENAFLANILTLQSAFIGLSDHITEGHFQWSNGDPITYSNWYAGQPNNYNNDQDYCEMLNDGTWNDQYNYKSLEYIMEIPECINVTQSGGPQSGSTFLPGTTTSVSYTATDECGNVEVCTFNITIEGDECTSGGLNSESVWIESVSFNNLANTSGNNDGYADFFDIGCAHVSPGNSYILRLNPGYKEEKIPVYWSAWIDYNMDGDFTDSNEYIAYGSGIQELSGVITMPTNMWNGETIMRVVMKTGAYPSSPCFEFNYGETEDYCIQVINAGDATQVDVETRNASHGTNPVSLVQNSNVLFENIITPAIIAYPTPANKVVNFELINMHDINKIENVTLHDMQGRIISTIEFDNSMHLTYNVNDLKEGMYVIRIALKDLNIITERFLVKH